MVRYDELRNRCAIATALVLLVAAPAWSQSEDEARSRLLEALKSYPYQLVFETNRDGNWELYMMNADGSGTKNLTKTADIDEVFPKNSPDGKQIAFVADSMEGKRRVRDVFVMGLDGKGRRKIADDARDPCWSPDGKRIAYLPAEYSRYTTSTWATRGLRIYDLKTKKTTVHANEDLEHLYSLDWSPDAKWIVATVHGGMGYSQAILAIQVDGDEVHDLGLFGCRPDLRPDGKKVAWGYGDYSIGVADIDFSGERPRVARRKRTIGIRSSRGRRRRSAPQTYHADWSPDGRFIVFSTGPRNGFRRFWGAMPQCPGVDAPGWNLCVAQADGKGPWVQLTTDGKSYKEADWVRVPKVSAK